MSGKTRVFFGVAALGALLGLIYSGTSTVDFIAHLDRQLHPVTCTLLPGMSEPSRLDPSSEGCKVALFSPYSSFFRDKYWGGIPYSLLAMGLFGFAFILALWAIATGRGHEIGPSLFMLFSGVVAAVVSIVFFFISIGKLHTVCTTCVGTYISSAVLLVGGVLAFLGSASDRKVSNETASGVGIKMGILAVEMGAAVLVPVVVYLATLPPYERYVTSCETLKSTEDRAGSLLSIGGKDGRTEALLVLDPLCPACKAFHRRLGETRYAKDFAYKLLLLPLDSECNWMLKDSMHPGSCLLSKALYCAGDRVNSVLEFIFENQEQLRMDGIGKRQDQIRAKIVEAFPNIKDCLDLPDTAIRLNKALHWAVKNSMPVLTPQLYLNGKRLCDEDTDLGLEYSLAQLLGK